MVPTTTALFGSVAVQVGTAQYDESPHTVTFSAPLVLSEDEMVAALFRYAEIGLPEEDLADVEYVRQMVAEQVLNAGLDELSEAVVRMRNLVPGSEMHAYVGELRAALRNAFPFLRGLPMPRQESESAPRAQRALAGAGALT